MIVRLNLAKMKQIVGSISEFEFKAKTLELHLEREGIDSVGPVRVKGQIENIGDRIFVANGQIELEATELCARCLEETKVRLKINFSFKFSDAILESEDEDIILFNGNVIDLYPQVINEIILNWPSQILCKTDCRGLCPNCGANMNITVCRCKSDNIDPRLAALKQLMKSE
ncbi:MAG: DUF177 domain-containing protein [Tepidanaerobacteraceae bacterium]|nr:DUF177 domain-containing protein [Tepidanaerobacteraceae bacterium]